MSLDDCLLFLSAVAAGDLTFEAVHLLGVHHRSSSIERSSQPLDSVTLVCVAVAFDDCTDGNHCRCCAVTLAGRTALYDHHLRPRPPPHLRLHHFLSQQKYRASTP